MDYMSTDFGADSSSCFPFRARTNTETDKQTDATERPTHAGGYTSNVGNKNSNGETNLLPRLSQNIICFVNDSGFALRKMSRHVIGWERIGSQLGWHSFNEVSILTVDSRTSEHINMWPIQIYKRLCVNNSSEVQ